MPDLETTKQRSLVFLVLVPHQDVRGQLRKYNDKLIKEGLTGVYDFPCVAPLAELSKAYNMDELKHFARSLRKKIGKDKISAEKMSSAVFPACTNMKLFGHNLEIENPPHIFEDKTKKIKSLFSPLIIGNFLIPEQKIESFVNPQPQLSFRAMAVANMYWRSFKTDGETGYKWKIGKLCWLPKNLT